MLVLDGLNRGLEDCRAVFAGCHVLNRFRAWNLSEDALT